MNTKRNKTKTLLMVGLLLAVVGLTLGFAAFSNTLTIKSSATVTPDASTFSVAFSSAEGSLSTDPIIPEVSSAYHNDTATNAIINNNGNPTISGIEINFSNPGSTVDYYFYIMNTGEYDAYFNEVIFNNVEGEDSNIVCTALTDEEGKPLATQSLVDEVCDGIAIFFGYDVDSADGGFIFEASSKALDSNGKTIILEKGSWEKVAFGVWYLSSARADGPFKIEIGDIELAFSSNDTNVNTTE